MRRLVSISCLSKYQEDHKSFIQERKEESSIEDVCVYIESNPNSIHLHPAHGPQNQAVQSISNPTITPVQPIAYSIALFTNAANSSAFDPAIIVK